MVVSMLLSSIAGKTSLFGSGVLTAFFPQPAAKIHKNRMAIAFAFFILIEVLFFNTINTELIRKSYSFYKTSFRLQNYKKIRNPSLCPNRGIVSSCGYGA